MSAKNVVIVESPAKAKTIGKYLGPDYQVIASFGHVRDLVPKSGSVQPEENFKMIWEENPDRKKQLSSILSAVKSKATETVYLATDPDREGEAISWHVLEALRARGMLKEASEKPALKRIMFHEITKDAIVSSLGEGRDIDTDLVDAYLARRALDYLVGYTLSPLLWRKLPSVRSAGRVQSVALRLVCEREDEIDRFVPVPYWHVGAWFQEKNIKFKASLRTLDAKKVDNFFFKAKEEALDAAGRIERAAFHVKDTEKKPVKRNPYAPFITSTLQQEASRKLYMSVTKTMKTAQSLYEGVSIGGETQGLITYMRTDGTNLSNEAIHATRSMVESKFGKDYLPSAPRVYKTKVQNAQEAHEAIRPTDIKLTPEKLTSYLNADQLALYRLIWQRTMACQMESARFDQTTVDIVSKSGDIELRTVGRVQVFPGFLAVYGEEDSDDEDKTEQQEDSRLPSLVKSQEVSLQQTVCDDHETKAPPRFSEASLVKQLENLGIGRPSTYASILSLLQAREYVKLEKRRFTPTFIGRLGVSFLKHYFSKYVDYSFTANFENILDDVASGKKNWLAEMKDFWQDFHQLVESVMNVERQEVMQRLDDMLSYLVYGTDDDEYISKIRACPKCDTGKVALRVSKDKRPFLSCSNYPDCKYILSLDEDGHLQEGAEATENQLPKLLGTAEKDGEPVYLNRGTYGFYVQKGMTVEKDKKDAKQQVVRASVPSHITEPMQITLAEAEKLLSLPRTLGDDPERGEKVLAGIGPFGPYVRSGVTFVSLKEDSVFDIGINRAITLIAEKRQKTGERVIGNHPKDEQPIVVARSRFGYCMQHSGKKYYLPKGFDVETLDMEIALDFIAKAPKTKTTKAKTKKRKKA